MELLKNQFILDPDVIFLNHGSFGATPRPVFETYQNWQRELEKQPVQFFATRLLDRLHIARKVLAEYIQSEEDEVVFISNATYGVNIVARSLNLADGDEILTTDHEYGACDYTWQYICSKTGASFIKQPVPFGPPEETLERIWEGVTPRTRLIFLSHITSPTAFKMPVKAICARARETGILSFVDGAHAPGMIPIDMRKIGADFYTGNCHKWMLSPKGAGFLYTQRDRQHLVEPLVVSWGWGGHPDLSVGNPYLDYFQWMGTDDPAAYLSVPAAIQFQYEHDWDSVHRACYSLARQTVSRMCEWTGLPSIYPQEDVLCQQMVVVPLPLVDNLPDLKTRLYNEFRVEVPCVQWGNHQFLRISLQAYNDSSDIDHLIGALEVLLPQVASGHL